VTIDQVNDLKKMNAEISFIIPAYNVEACIKQAIDSILAQTIQNFEVIIVDDHSTDNTVSMIEKINDNRIKLYKIEHGGASKARNFGVSKATTDFIAFLDADDELAIDYIENMLIMKEKYPSAGFYFGRHLRGQKKILKDNYTLITNYFSFHMNDTSSTGTTGLALFKTIFEEMNGFDEKAAWGEDGDLCFRITLKYTVVFCNKICVIGHDTGNWKNKVYKRLLITNEHPFIKNGKNALKQKNVLKYLINDLVRLISNLQINSAYNNIIIGNFSKAKEIINEMDNRYYRWQKIYLKFWIDLSKLITVRKSHILFHSSLTILMAISKYARAHFHIKIITPF
jgi:glycosyltransferase involved in cell wall biosynthesis